MDREPVKRIRYRYRKERFIWTRRRWKEKGIVADHNSSYGQRNSEKNGVVLEKNISYGQKASEMKNVLLENRSVLMDREPVKRIINDSIFKKEINH
jgi:hypothetical protein